MRKHAGKILRGIHLYRCFNGAATLSLRKRQGTGFVPNTRSCFNGAATLSLRKREGYLLCGVRNMDASMGPQLYRCGNLRGFFNPISTLVDGFNGAATLSLRKRDRSCGSLGTSACFNGAATLSLRKRAARWIWAHSPVLQWGRNFIVAETIHITPIHYHCRFASMGPQLYRCGNMTLIFEAKQGGMASMGPQLYRCGN